MEIERPSRLGVASTMRCPTIPRRTRRAIGTTTIGSRGAIRPPSRTAARRGRGRNAGTCGASAARLRAATVRSSGRITPSTKPTVKSRPLGSFSTPARRSAEALAGTAEASESQRRTSTVDAAASSAWGSRSVVVTVSCTERRPSDSTLDVGSSVSSTLTAVGTVSGTAMSSQNGDNPQYRPCVP